MDMEVFQMRCFSVLQTLLQQHFTVHGATLFHDASQPDDLQAVFPLFFHQPSQCDRVVGAFAPALLK
eukprot:1929874-Amphidinium_carterae.1